MGDTLAGRIFRLARSTSLGMRFKRAVAENPALAPVYKLLVQRMIDYRWPRTCNIEPTNACNQRCRMCPRELSAKGVGKMDFDLFRKIVDESAAYGPRNFVLHKDGEPLLHPRIFDMVRYIKERNPGSTVYMSTNGELLEDRRADALLETDLDQLHISIGATTQATFSRVRGSRFPLERLEAQVREFVRKQRMRGLRHPVVTVQILRMEETRREVDEFRRRWGEEDVEISIPDFLTWGGGVERDTSVRGQDWRYRWPCHALWLSPSINWNGQVSICCVDWKPEEVLGDVRESTLASLWQGAKIRQYRRDHLAGEHARIPICRDCNYWRETPDFWFRRQRRSARSGNHPPGRAGSESRS